VAWKVSCSLEKCLKYTKITACNQDDRLRKVRSKPKGVEENSLSLESSKSKERRPTIVLSVNQECTK